jgi:hypothetical protein
MGCTINNMNRGKFTVKTYTKYVRFSTAVLWKDRELSLPVDIIAMIRSRKVTKIVFIDTIKGEKWYFDPKKVFEKMELKKVGQELQYYFPIDLKNVHKLVSEKKDTFEQHDLSVANENTQGGLGI